MPQNNNYYSLFAIKQGDRFISNFIQGVITVRTIDNGIATIDFDCDKEKHRNGEAWKISDIERKLADEDLHRLISRQFRRKNHDGSFTRGYGFWEDMAEKDSWGFVCQFLPDYERRDDVATSDDLACVIDNEKTLEWLYAHFPEWDGLSIEELKKVRAQWDYELFQEAEGYLTAAIQSGEIEVREFSVSIVSASIQGDENNDKVWLQCADMTRSNYREERRIPSCDLQNVRCRWIDEGTDSERFQILYENQNTGDFYWCNAQSIDFE